MLFLRRSPPGGAWVHWAPGCALLGTTGLHLDHWLALSRGRGAMAEAWPIQWVPSQAGPHIRVRGWFVCQSLQRSLP